MEHSRRRDAIASIIAVAMLILLPIIGFLAIGLEDVFTKWEIQNPHVNKRYKGWKEASLFDNETIKIEIPQEMYDGLETGQYGEVTLVEGELYSFII